MKRTYLPFRLLFSLWVLTAFQCAAQNAPLKKGDWAKVGWVNDGVYALRGSDLTALGLGSGPWASASIGVYHNPTGMLPERNNQPRPNGLQTLPIRLDDGGDGQFNATDVLYFYGSSPHVWNYNASTGRYEHVQHIYSDTAFAFVTTTEGGARLPLAPLVSGIPDKVLTRTRALAFHEKEQRNLVGSGRQWFGELFDYTLVHPVGLDLPPLDEESRVRFQARAAMRTTQLGPKLVWQWNGQEIASAEGNPIGTSAGADVAATVNLNGVHQPGVAGVPSYTMALDRGSVSGAIAHLDWVRAEADVPLVQYQRPIWIRNPSDSALKVVYEVQQAANGAIVWEVGSKSGKYRERPATRVGNVLSFAAVQDSARTFVVFAPSQAMTPVLKGSVENQHIKAIRDVDYVVITPAAFLPAAERLAEFHRGYSHYRTAVVEVNQIYNEFSSGAQDLVAIRDFLKRLRDSASTPQDRPEYVVLLGDASYDYKNRLANKHNFVPIYQSVASFSLYSSYCLDDFIGYLDPNEGANFTSQGLDIGIGRLPVISLEEAQEQVDKIIGYATDTTALGPWRKRLVFVADDADAGWESTFSAAQEVLANRVESELPFMTVSKIYTDAFLQQSSSGSQSYPAARQQLLRALEEGNLVTSYLGHGGEVGWCSENLLQLQDVKSFKNGHRLPLVVTITCEFSRLDDPMRRSAGEEMLINPKGGAIALLSTTRVVGAFEGAVMNDSIFSELFKREDNRYRTLGQIVRGAKNGVRSNDKMRFTLLGDPGLRLNVPRYGAIWDSLNGSALPVAGTAPSDTLKALAEVSASGYVVDDYGQFLPAYQGFAQIELLDKKVQRSTLVNDDQGVAVPFMLQENAVYRGRVSVKNGRFTVRFRVPLDIALNVGPGKLTAYVYNDTSDGVGSRTDIRVGGLRNDAPLDAGGPTIVAFMNDTLFQAGGITGVSPTGLARLFDPSGINAVGNGIGHDILGALDGRWDQAVVLNDAYESDLDRFDRGTVRLPFSDLTEGPHTFSVRAWDAYNNPAVGSVDFVVVSGQLLRLDQLFLYPNPSTGPVTVSFSHNQDGRPLEVSVSLHAQDGRTVRTYEWEGTPQGNQTEVLTWDLNDAPQGPLPSGWYWVRLQAKSSLTGEKETQAERLVLIP
jgi:hypothetical protein